MTVPTTANYQDVYERHLLGQEDAGQHSVPEFHALHWVYCTKHPGGKRKKLVTFSELGQLAYCKGCGHEVVISWEAMETYRAKLQGTSLEIAYCTQAWHPRRKLAVYTASGLHAYCKEKGCKTLMLISWSDLDAIRQSCQARAPRIAELAPMMAAQIQQ